MTLSTAKFRVSQIFYFKSPTVSVNENFNFTPYVSVFSGMIYSIALKSGLNLNSDSL